MTVFRHHRGETSNENVEGRDERIAKVRRQIKRHAKTRMLAKEEVSDAMMHILNRDKEWMFTTACILTNHCNNFSCVYSDSRIL